MVKPVFRNQKHSHYKKAPFKRFFLENFPSITTPKNLIILRLSSFLPE